jgi:hypothetical protein
MNYRFQARHLLLVFFLPCLLWLTACSYITNFVIVNASGQVVEVRYTIKKPSDPRAPSGEPVVLPATKAVLELQQQTPWNELPTSQYSLDRENRELVVSLMPGQGLLVEQPNLLDGSTDEAHQAENFSLERIDISGSSGEVHLQGEQARKAFVPVSKKPYTLTYR